jgi:hypothetical protein
MSETEKQAPTTGEVLAAIERERAAWEALLAEVGEARMLEPGPMGEWSFKDLAAHLTGWRARSLQRLEAAANGQPEPAPLWPAALQTDDEINAWIHELNQERLLGEVIAESRESYARLAEIVQKLPEEALSDPNYFPWTEGSALGEAIVNGTFFGHLHEEHEPDLRRWLSASR